MASINYTSFFLDSVKGNIDVDVDTFKMMLCTATYTPNKDHTKRSDITNEVSAGGGYTAGGNAVTLTPTHDTANDRLDINTSQVDWPTATFTARYAVIYKSRGGASSADELVACIDFGSDKTASGGTFSVLATSTPIRIAN